MHKMEADPMQFGAEWSLGQMYESSPYDDLKLSEADDGLNDLSFPSKPLHGQDKGFQQDMEPQLPGHDEWMEQTQLEHFPDIWLDLLDVEDFGSAPHADFSDILIDNASLKEPVTQSSENVGLLEALLKQNAEVGTLLTQAAPEVAATPVKQEISIKVELATSPPPCSSPEAQVAPVISFSDVSADPATLQSVDIDLDYLTPLSPEDIESVFSANSSVWSPSSEELSPTSTTESFSFDTSSSLIENSSTLDTSTLYSDESNKSSVIHQSELYKIVANDQHTKQRGTPYSRPQTTKSKNTKSKGRKQTACISPNPSELELEFMSKKDRKKLQNKNAAIRYRMKKKEEAETKTSVVGDLETINESLHEKVADLTRQITYMKDLINDVHKARGLKAPCST